MIDLISQVKSQSDSKGKNSGRQLRSHGLYFGHLHIWAGTKEARRAKLLNRPLEIWGPKILGALCGRTGRSPLGAGLNPAAERHSCFFDV